MTQLCLVFAPPPGSALYSQDADHPLCSARGLWPLAAYSEMLITSLSVTIVLHISITCPAVARLMITWCTPPPGCNGLHCACTAAPVLWKTQPCLQPLGRRHHAYCVSWWSILQDSAWWLVAPPGCIFLRVTSITYRSRPVAGSFCHRTWCCSCLLMSSLSHSLHRLHVSFLHSLDPCLVAIASWLLLMA